MKKELKELEDKIKEVKQQNKELKLFIKNVKALHEIGLKESIKK